jgi:hypothetical protein
MTGVKKETMFLEDYIHKLVLLQRQVLYEQEDEERKIFNRMVDKLLLETAYKLTTMMERRLFFHGSPSVQKLLRTLPPITAPSYYANGMLYRNDDKMKDLLHRTKCMIDPDNFSHPRLPSHKQYLLTL